jgi:adhesin HecA-like repeat protein
MSIFCTAFISPDWVIFPSQEKTQGGLIYAKNQLQITAANQLLNDKSSIVAEGDIVINDTNHGTNNDLNLVIDSFW